MKNKSLSMTIAIIVIVLNLSAQETGTLSDSRDGKVYKTIKIGTQTWMAQNLNYKTNNSWCNQCEIFGRLYLSSEAKNICPSGWHLPSDGEWLILIKYLGGDMVAGGKMKDSTLWKSPNTGASNSCGFTAIPSGYCKSDGSYYDMGNLCKWWSSTNGPNPSITFGRSIGNDNPYVSQTASGNVYGFSVRCVKD